MVELEPVADPIKEKPAIKKAIVEKVYEPIPELVEKVLVPKTV